MMKITAAAKRLSGIILPVSVLAGLFLFCAGCQPGHDRRQSARLEVIRMKTDCAAGTVLKESDMEPVALSLSGRTAIGVPWQNRHSVTGMKLKQDLYAGTRLSWSDLELKPAEQ